MLPFKASCPDCGAANNITDEQSIGTNIACQACGQSFMVSEPLAADEKQCPVCGGRIKSVARKCRHCGEMFEANPDDQRRIEEAAKLLVRENQDKTTALQLLITGVLGCFSPILAIYGTIFLLRRSYPFPRKTMAIVGTVLHWVWSILTIIWILLAASMEM